MAMTPSQYAMYPASSPYPATPAYSAPAGGTGNVYGLVSQLGQRTFVAPSGMVQFNEPLIQQILAFGPQAVPALDQFMRRTVPYANQRLFPVLEALYTAERLAEAGVPEVTRLYPLTSYLNTNPNPLLQIYLAGFYREINRPETFGPMLSSLMHQTRRQYNQPNPYFNPTEELGGTLLSQIAKTTAKETVKELMTTIQRGGL